MRTFIPAIVFLAVFSFQAHAGENKLSPSELKTAISKKISVPEKLRKPDFSGSVLVSFEVKENGRLDVLAINSANPELGTHVQEQLEKILLNVKAQPGQVYNMRLNFKVIQ
jgi:hypothetical protein